MRALEIPHDYSSAAKMVTISMGGVSCQYKSSLDAKALVESADAQLYLAKEQGRNRALWERLA